MHPSPPSTATSPQSLQGQNWSFAVTMGLAGVQRPDCRSPNVLVAAYWSTVSRLGEQRLCYHHGVVSLPEGMWLQSNHYHTRFFRALVTAQAIGGGGCIESMGWLAYGNVRVSNSRAVALHSTVRASSSNAGWCVVTLGWLAYTGDLAIINATAAAVTSLIEVQSAGAFMPTISADASTVNDAIINLSFLSCNSTVRSSGHAFQVSSPPGALIFIDGGAFNNHIDSERRLLDDSSVRSSTISHRQLHPAMLRWFGIHGEISKSVVHLRF